MKKKESSGKRNSQPIPAAIIWILYILGIVITVASLIYIAYNATRKQAKTADKNTEAPAVSEEPASDNTENPGWHLMNDRITIPDYDDMTVSSGQPLMGFNNPIENKDIALLKYTVDVNYESEDIIPLIQEEMWVLPGKTLPIDIAGQLDPGIYKARISIMAKDPEVDDELGIDVQYITITVN